MSEHTTETKGPLVLAALLTAFLFISCANGDEGDLDPAAPDDSNLSDEEQDENGEDEEPGENGEENDEEGEEEDPEKPQPAPLPDYSGGDCPPMSAGTVAISSGANQRQVHLDVPDQPGGAPVLFVYHGAGSNAEQFVSFFRTAHIASTYGVIVVTPSSTGLFQYEWPFLDHEDASVDTVLFTDVLACLDQQYEIDLARVYTTGFSAGGLWSTYLMMHMSEHLASVAIFSGGTGGMASAYQPPSWRIPVLATHGGPTDQVVIRFDISTEEMAVALVDDGHLVIVCAHDGGHTIPWDIPSLMMPFLLSHAFGVPDLTILEDGLDDSWPSECAIR